MSRFGGEYKFPDELEEEKNAQEVNITIEDDEVEVKVVDDTPQEDQFATPPLDENTQQELEKADESEEYTKNVKVKFKQYKISTKSGAQIMPNVRSKAIRGEIVILSIQYYGTDGLPVNADSIPEITIKDIDGTTVIAPTTTEVTRTDVGLYEYSYTVPRLAEKGNWSDTWYTTISGISVQNVFQFLVVDEASATAGSIRLGDDVEFDFNEQEILGINILLKYLKARLRSSGRKPVRDEYGAILYDGYGEVITE